MSNIAIYGVSLYGKDFYGYDFPPQFRVDPFVAVNLNYSSIQITWTKPTGTIYAYRLIKNLNGFPVDQDDGQILIDSASYPGSQYTDTTAKAGTYQYYAFYVQTNQITDVWVRAAVTACLAINNYNSGLAIHSLIPSFYHLQEGPQASLVDDFPSEILDFFCEVLGWGMDYLKTQYDTYLNVNDPWKIPLNDLLNLAAQLGININPDIHPYTLRKAVYYNAAITQQRGTTSGLVQELAALTGWSADLTLVSNFMLENDQSAFIDPIFLPWSANLSYNINEYVGFGNYWYQCIATGNIGHSPTGANSANTWWTPIVNVNDTSLLFLKNPKTNNPNTWELIYPTATNGVPPAATFYEQLGVSNPLNTTNFQYNDLIGINKSGSTTTLWLRSVSRSIADLAVTTTTFAPNKDQIVGDGTPVPFASPSLVWNGTTWTPTTRYGTNQIISYSFQPFIALRASTNVTPPYLTQASFNNEWAPVGMDERFRICISSFVNSTAGSVTATPFVEWYDASGNFITRIIARNTSAGVVGLPTGLIFDSFTSAITTTGLINPTRTTDDGSVKWTARTGTFNLSAFSGGCAYPAIASQRTYATVSSGVSNCQVGITFITNPVVGDVQGLILRWQDDNNYLRATMTEIDLKQNGSFTTLGTYSIPAKLNDRLIVTLNGSTITAFINNVQVLQVTSSFNTSGTIHGIINEGSVLVASPGTQSNPQGTAI